MTGKCKVKQCKERQDYCCHGYCRRHYQESQKEKQLVFNDFERDES